MAEINGWLFSTGKICSGDNVEDEEKK